MIMLPPKKILPLSTLIAVGSGVINRHYLMYADAGQHSELRLKEFIQTSLFYPFILTGCCPPPYPWVPEESERRRNPRIWCSTIKF